MTATSWTSRTASVARPVSVLVMPRWATDLHGDGGRAHGERQADDQRGLPGEADEHERRRRGRRWWPTIWVTPRPSTWWRMRQSSLGCDFEADQEQHHDDAELGDLADRLGVGDEAQAIGADDDAGGEIAEDGAEPRPLGQRHQQHGGGQEDEDREQEIAFHGTPARRLVARVRTRRL